MLRKAPLFYYKIDNHNYLIFWEIFVVYLTHITWLKIWIWLRKSSVNLNIFYQTSMGRLTLFLFRSFVTTRHGLQVENQCSINKAYQPINQLSKAYAKEYITSSTLHYLSLKLLLAGLHAGPHLIASMSNHDSMTSQAMSSVDVPSASSTKGSLFGKQLYGQGQLPKSIPHAHIDWVGTERLLTVTAAALRQSNQQYLMILRRHLLPKASVYLSKSLVTQSP